jgi:protein-tyrosine phosphatase
MNTGSLRSALVRACVLSAIALSSLVAVARPPARTKTVLFICTGNYYRSRYAQAVFNEQATPGWSAVSRGLDTSTPHSAPVSPLVVADLTRRHIDLARVAGTPQPLTRKDLDAADVVVLLDGAEHEPMLRKQFPDFPFSKVRSWSVQDVPRTQPADAFAAIWSEVESLVGDITAPPPKRYDVRTDVALKKALAEAAKIELSERSASCVSRMSGAFSHVILVGSFADDRGCFSRGYFADGIYVTSREHAKEALATAGWADRAKRIGLATTWVERAFDASVQGAARASIDASGAVVIDAVRTLPSGETPERSTQALTIRFSNAGDTKIEITKTSTQPL